MLEYLFELIQDIFFYCLAKKIKSKKRGKHQTIDQKKELLFRHLFSSRKKKSLLLLSYVLCPKKEQETIKVDFAWNKGPRLFGCDKWTCFLDLTKSNKCPFEKAKNNPCCIVKSVQFLSFKLYVFLLAMFIFFSVQS